MRRPALAVVLTLLAGGVGLALWFLTRPSGGPPGEGARLSGDLLFVRAGPGIVMAGGETSIASNPRLMLLRLTDGTSRTLVEGGVIGRPAPSPDGSRAVFPWARVLGDGPPVPSLYVVRLDGSGLSRLTYCRPPRCTADLSPSWSPDGSRIVFLRSSGSGQRLLLVDVADGHVHPIDLPDLVPFSGASWSPDGHRLVFSAYPAGSTSKPEIYVIRTDGTGLRRITSCHPPCRGGYADPAWSPDGTKIVAVQGYGGAGRLYVMAPDGSGLRQLTDPNGAGLEDQAPAWARTGDWVVFARGGDFGGDVYAVRVDGAGSQQLTSGPWLDSAPAWVMAADRVDGS